MRIAMTALAASLTLAGCATRPQLAHEGSLAILRAIAVAPQASQAAPDGSDAALAQAVQAHVMTRVGEMGALQPGPLGPRFLVQVAVGTSDPAVGVSTAASLPVAQSSWRSAPTKRRFWSSRHPVRTTSLTILDINGQVAAWATIRSYSTDANDLADRLIKALSAPPAKG